MKLKPYFLFVFLVLISFGCKKQESPKKIVKTKVESVFELDHINIWVKNPDNAKSKLNKIGFTSLPDSLSQTHKGQGTIGKYFYFLNTYLELIYVQDQNEFEKNNALNNSLDFKIRANSTKNGASPFSVALKLKEYEINQIPFDKVKYNQIWMSDSRYIYVAKNSKLFPKEPSVFVIYPEIESEYFESLKDVEKIPEKYAFVKDWYKHKNLAKKITNIVITTNSTNLQTETIKEIIKLKEITLKKGEHHLMELYFDNNIQHKSFDLRPELPLIIHL